jgi:uncharacterized protein YjiS (DUF1127 family)
LLEHLDFSQQSQLRKDGMPTTTPSTLYIRPRCDEGFARSEPVDLLPRRHRTRQVLRDRDPHRLADIGITEAQRAAECAQPFRRA